jgi:hypothetical protein
MRIIQVSENKGSGKTSFDASRPEAIVYASSTEIAFVGSMANGVEKTGIVRTSGNAHSATDAFAVIHYDDPVLISSNRGLNRADLYTWRCLALIAEPPQEHVAHVRESPLLDSFHPRAPVAKGNIVLTLTGDSAAMATNAAALIDHHSPAFGSGRSWDLCIRVRTGLDHSNLWDKSFAH